MVAQLQLKLMQTEQWLATSQAAAQRSAAECRIQAGQLDALREEMDESQAAAAAGVSNQQSEKMAVRTIEPSALQLSSELKREVEAVRKEWTASTNALALAQAEAVSAVAERAVAPQVEKSTMSWLGLAQASPPPPLLTSPPHTLPDAAPARSPVLQRTAHLSSR